MGKREKKKKKVPEGIESESAFPEFLVCGEKTGGGKGRKGGTLQEELTNEYYSLIAPPGGRGSIERPPWSIALPVSFTTTGKGVHEKKKKKKRGVISRLPSPTQSAYGEGERVPEKGRGRLNSHISFSTAHEKGKEVERERGEESQCPVTIDWTRLRYKRTWR